MLLLVALASVLTAVFATLATLNRDNEVYNLYEREGWLSRAIDYYGPTDPATNAMQKELDQIRDQLGKNPKQKN